MSLLPRVRAEMGSTVNLAAKAAAFITTDRIIEDLMLEERLDGMIDRAIRRLAQGKMMKQVSWADNGLPRARIISALENCRTEEKAGLNQNQNNCIIFNYTNKLLYCELKEEG